MRQKTNLIDYLDIVMSMLNLFYLLHAFILKCYTESLAIRDSLMKKIISDKIGEVSKPGEEGGGGNSFFRWEGVSRGSTFSDHTPPQFYHCH